MYESEQPLDRETGTIEMNVYESAERELDENEEREIQKFYLHGCGCKINKSSSCHTQFPIEHYKKMRNECMELTKESLDCLIVGQIMAKFIHVHVLTRYAA